MAQSDDQLKKCYCARCFLPVESNDKVFIEGQNYHRQCSMCCVCRTIPSSLKMFYGHVFCNECFKTQVINRFRREVPRLHSNGCWMQWASGNQPLFQEEEKDTPEKDQSQKKCICSRCLQSIDPRDRLEIDGENFHANCAKCYFCQTVPISNLKIYYSQVFCEGCFHRYVLNQKTHSSADFFKNCFDQWRNNPKFAENMNEFMSGSGGNIPYVFMMERPQPSCCGCGNGHREWFQTSKTNESGTPVTTSAEDLSIEHCDLSFENRTEVFENHTEVSDFVESSCKESATVENLTVSAEEKIEKLTKYLYGSADDEKNDLKKWKNFKHFKLSPVSTATKKPVLCSWINLQDPKKTKSKLKCPNCLWQCGPIYVNSEYLQKQIFCGKYFY